MTEHKSDGTEATFPGGMVKSSFPKMINDGSEICMGIVKGGHEDRMCWAEATEVDNTLYCRMR